jgi:phosphoribosylformylglycinamidine synthase
MSLAVPPESIDAFLELAKRREVEATVLGRFTDSGVFEVAYAEGTVARLDLEFMHDGLPQLRIPAVWTPPVHPEPEIPDDLDLGEALVQVLGRLNVCSGEEKARQYDHEVKGLSAIKPYIGVNGNVAGDAAVMLVDSPESTEAVILAGGVAPRYSDIDTYHMMASVIDIAVRRVMAVGGRLGHIAGLDNFCWPDPVLSDKTPDGPYKMAQLVRANQALYDYTVAFGVPCVSGKDSMKNDSTLGGRKISIPPTVLFSTVARMADVSKAVTLDAKRTGDLVYVIGLTRSELGGSEFYAHLNAVGTSVPTVDAGLALAVYDRIGQATDRELCRSLHTPVFGGLAMAFARKAMGGCLGLDIDLDAVPVDDPGMGAAERLFSESNSRFVATVATADREAFEGILDGVPWACVGHVDLDPVLTLRSDGTVVASDPDLSQGPRHHRARTQLRT